jgi:hypothetical protein
MIKVKIIIPIIMIIIITGALIIIAPNEETSKNTIEEKWIKSGPFELDKSQYNIGEKIFLTTNNVLPEEKGTVQFLRPINDTHHKSYIRIPFDGMDRSQFNFYFEPRYNQHNGICSIDNIAGNWIVKFIGTQYEDINFEILAQPSSWDERTFEPIC